MLDGRYEACDCGETPFIQFGNGRACAMAGFITKVVAAAYLYEKMRGKDVSVFILSTSRET
jgi:hypothetical protein